jgi:hypothetical protein
MKKLLIILLLIPSLAFAKTKNKSPDLNAKFGTTRKRKVKE